MSHSDRINEAAHYLRAPAAEASFDSLAREPQNRQWNVGMGGMMSGVKHQPLKIHTVAGVGTATIPHMLRDIEECLEKCSQ